jgi:hypothetical protein
MESGGRVYCCSVFNFAYAVTSAQCEGWWFFGLVGGWDANVFGIE